MHNEIVPNTQQSEVLTFARQLRSRFGDGVKLRYHRTAEGTQGRQPYWWREVHENGDGL